MSECDLCGKETDALFCSNKCKDKSDCGFRKVKTIFGNFILHESEIEEINNVAELSFVKRGLLEISE